jgi:hypothetical protein
VTPDQFNSILLAIDWRKADLQRALAQASGHPVASSTMAAYAAGKAPIPAGVCLALELLHGAKLNGFDIPRPDHMDKRYKGVK